MPAHLLTDFVEMMQKIRAEEMLIGVTVHQLGGGILRREDALRVFRQIERQANGGERQPSSPVQPELAAAALAQMGITLKHE